MTERMRPGKRLSDVYEGDIEELWYFTDLMKTAFEEKKPALNKERVLEIMRNHLIQLVWRTDFQRMIRIWTVRLTEGIENVYQPEIQAFEHTHDERAFVDASLPVRRDHGDDHACDLCLADAFLRAAYDRAVVALGDKTAAGDWLHTQISAQTIAAKNDPDADAYIRDKIPPIIWPERDDD